MSAAEARQAAGTGHQIAVPGPRAANSARGRGTPSGAGHEARGGTKYDSRLPSAGGPPRTERTVREAGLAAPVTELHVQGLEVRELRMTQVRAVEAVEQQPHGSRPLAGGPAGGATAGPEAGTHVPAVLAPPGHISARHISASRVSARRVSAGQVPASRISASQVSAVRASASPVAATHAPIRPAPPGRRTVSTGSRADRGPQGRPGALRLTRRGCRVVAALALALTAAVVVLIWLAAAGGAAASDHGAPARAAYQGLTQVVVRPGQTLWSIAAASEPSADPRVVIQQIVEANALSGATIHTGQLLWVPKS
jgi:hypothetical protein